MLENQFVITKEFVMAGKAVFTLSISEEYRKKHDLPTHYTYRVWPSKYHSDGFCVEMMTGSDNQNDYSIVGILRKDGHFHLTHKTRYTMQTPPVMLVKLLFDRIWQNNVQAVFDAGFNIQHQGRCCHCRKPLTNPESIRTGFGPKCRKYSLAA